MKNPFALLQSQPTQTDNNPDIEIIRIRVRRWHGKSIEWRIIQILAILALLVFGAEFIIEKINKARAVSSSAHTEKAR